MKTSEKEDDLNENDEENEAEAHLTNAEQGTDNLNNEALDNGNDANEETEEVNATE